MDTDKLLKEDQTPAENTDPDSSTGNTDPRFERKILGNYNYNNTSCYDCVLNKVRNGDSFVATQVIEKAMQRSKKTKFPPALEENLHDIYRYS